MRQKAIRFMAVAAMAAGMAVAQTAAPAPAPAPQPGQKAGRLGMRRMFVNRMAKALNLTDAQKQQAKGIFQQAKQDGKPVAQQLRDNRQALNAAVKAYNSGQIQSLAAQQGQLMAQMVTIRAEARAKFYATLTPEQRAKADQVQQQVRQRVRQRIQQRRAGQNG
jgi:periplasmic protein CpxP/Spy